MRLWMSLLFFSLILVGSSFILISMLLSLGYR